MNKIEITVRHGGNKVFLSENLHHKIGHVLQKALDAFKEEHGFTPPQNNTVSLSYGESNLSDPNKSLAEYGIPDKAVLDLVLIPGAG